MIYQILIRIFLFIGCWFNSTLWASSLFQNQIATPMFQKVLNFSSIGVANKYTTYQFPIVDYTLNTITRSVQGQAQPSWSWYQNHYLGDNLVLSGLSDLTLDSIIWGCLDDLSMRKEVLPKKKDYTGYLILGATLDRVRLEVAFLNTLIQKNIINSAPVYILAGERTLYPERGEVQNSLFNPENGIVSFHPQYKIPRILPVITDERDMMRLVIRQSLSLKFSEIYYIGGDKINGTQRATTESTFQNWLTLPNCLSGTFFVVSCQPVISYQNSILQRILLTHSIKTISIEVGGPGLNFQLYKKYLKIGKSKLAGYLLNFIARTCYEMQKIEKMKSSPMIQIKIN